MKTCGHCKETLPLNEFHKRTYASGNIGYQNKCKKCTTTVKRSYYKPHERIRKTLGISDTQFEQLMMVDNCEICNVALEKKNIDHCHSSGKVRGVLCNNCNTALGLVGDNVKTLSRMIDYLNQSQEQ